MVRRRSTGIVGTAPVPVAFAVGHGGLNMPAGDDCDCDGPGLVMDVNPLNENAPVVELHVDVGIGNGPGVELIGDDSGGCAVIGLVVVVGVVAVAATSAAPDAEEV